MNRTLDTLRYSKIVGIEKEISSLFREHIVNKCDLTKEEQKEGVEAFESSEEFDVRLEKIKEHLYELKDKDYKNVCVITNSVLIFHLLKLAGIPIWRWEDMALTDCPVAEDYRLRLIQLPCHQELKQMELDWMIGILRSVVAELRQ